MNTTRNLLAIVTGLTFAAVASPAAEDPVAPFPAPADGQLRQVIRLKPMADESLLKVELIVGKSVKTDGVNRHFFGGTIQPTNLQGWGYTYYVVPQLGPMAGTLMAAQPGAPKVETFVRMNHKLGLLRYNSKLPIVVYTPAGVEVRYRIWSAAEKATAAVEE